MLMLDAIRAVIILAVSILAFAGKARVWELYLMNMLVAAGFFPKRYQALKPRVTAEAAHTVSAMRKGTKREVRRDIVA